MKGLIMNDKQLIEGALKHNGIEVAYTDERGIRQVVHKLAHPAVKAVCDRLAELTQPQPIETASVGGQVDG
jgi:hypothetical protein